MFEGPNKVLRFQHCQKGQTAVEFSLILPFFIGVVFVIVSFFLWLIVNQMTFYATYMASRVHAVGGNYKQAASEIVPGIYVVAHIPGSPALPNDHGQQFDMTGRYTMFDFLNRKSGALLNPIREKILDIKSVVGMESWPVTTGSGDNPIP